MIKPKLLRRKMARGFLVMTFTTKNISLSQIGSYLAKLQKINGFIHLGYITINTNWGSTRYGIVSKYWTPEVIQYFKDRCPAIVEDEVRKIDVHYPHYIHEDKDGFKEVVYGEVPENMKGEIK